MKKLNLGQLSVVLGVSGVLIAIAADKIIYRVFYPANSNMFDMPLGYVRAMNYLTAAGFFFHLFCLCLAAISLWNKEENRIWGRSGSLEIAYHLGSIAS